jgi:ubiquitin C-terminal hydrolase
MLNWYKYSYDKNKDKKILSNAYAHVIDNLYFPKENNNYSKSFSPEVLKEIIGALNPLFQGIQANDSKDIYNYLIEKMHNELNDLYKPAIDNYNQNERYDQTDEQLTLQNFKRMFAQNYHSILSKYLYGIQKTITQCCNCQKNIYNFQTYNFLIFPLLDVKNYIINYYQQQNQFINYQNYTLTLNDCFIYYQKIDFFCGENSIHCNICRSMQNSRYCNLLYSVPTILSIVLNRGKNNADFKERILFGLDLDLSSMIEENKNSAKYYLIGVVCHVGDSSMSGHFFAYCRSHYTSKWYLYNDAIVSESNENKILSEQTPYILFYHKYT